MMAKLEPQETEVTVRIHDEESNIHLCNGLMKDMGCPVTGGVLDPDAEVPFEVGSGEIELQLLGYDGSVKEVDAWLHSPRLGQQYILKHCKPLETNDRLVESNVYYFSIGL